MVSDPRHGPLPALLLALTIVTGLVDAVSILSLGRVFVANMTGNVVFIAFAVAGAAGFSLGSSLAALAGFLLGAGAGGLLGRRLASHRGHLLLAGSILELVCVGAGLVILALEPKPVSPVSSRAPWPAWWRSPSAPRTPWSGRWGSLTSPPPCSPSPSPG